MPSDNFNSAESSSESLAMDDIITTTIDRMSKNRISTPPLIYKEGTMQSERYETLPNRAAHEKLLRDSIEIILSTAVFEDNKRENKVLEWHQPDELQRLFDMSLKNGSDSDEKLLELIQNVIRYSVKTGHPYFVNQLFSCVDAYALIGQWLTDALNPSVYTYEVSPVFILMEEIVLREMRSIIGWPSGKGDGLFSPGGSISNGYGISCARFKFVPDVKVNTKIKFQSSKSEFEKKNLFFVHFRPKDYMLYLVWLCSHQKMRIIHRGNWLRLWA